MVDSDFIKRVVAALAAFVQAPTWDESLAILKAHPELLSEEAEEMCDRVARTQVDERALRRLEEHRAVLRRARVPARPPGVRSSRSDVVTLA